jgi:hypothetical protein
MKGTMANIKKLDHSHRMVFGLKFIMNKHIVLFRILSEKEIFYLEFYERKKLANQIPALGE